MIWEFWFRLSIILGALAALCVISGFVLDHVSVH
jgi:hypothetical protein